MVYKLTERANKDGRMEPVAKKSVDKATAPGAKLAFRSYEYSLADCEHVISGSESALENFVPGEGWEDLLTDFVVNGTVDSQFQVTTGSWRRRITMPRRSPSCRSPRSRSCEASP